MVFDCYSQREHTGGHYYFYSAQIVRCRCYTDYAGLEIPVDSAVALRTGKTEMLVPVKHWSLWAQMGFLALPSDRVISAKNDIPLGLLGV